MIMIMGTTIIIFRAGINQLSQMKQAGNDTNKITGPIFHKTEKYSSNINGKKSQHLVKCPKSANSSSIVETKFNEK